MSLQHGYQSVRNTGEQCGLFPGTWMSARRWRAPLHLDRDAVRSEALSTLKHVLSRSNGSCIDHGIVQNVAVWLLSSFSAQTCCSLLSSHGTVQVRQSSLGLLRVHSEGVVR